MLESSGEVVTREELRSRLWRADTYVDFGHRLATAISKMRDALKDSAENERLVETVGRRGYRFMVSEESTPTPAEASQQQTVPKQPLHRRASAVLRIDLVFNGRDV